MSVITYDREESVLRGQVPLLKFKEYLGTLKLDEVTDIDFSNNGYCTDSVIKVILDFKKDRILGNLKSVNLTGCKLVTDHGIRWLAQIIAGAPIISVNLNSCNKVTDDGLFFLNESLGNSTEKTSFPKISVQDTSVKYASSIKGKILAGHPVFPIVGDVVNHKTGNVLVVPHPSMKQSLGSCLSGGSGSTGEGPHHYPQVKFEDDWKLNLNEVSMNNPLFDVLARSNPPQVVLPFDASATPKEISAHIRDAITRISMRENGNPEMESHRRENNIASFDNAQCFMDKKAVSGHDFDIETGILQTKVSKSENKELGFYFSRQPFSKSYPYFEIELIEYKGDLEKQMKNVEENSDDQVFIGCLHEQTFIMRNIKKESGLADGMTFPFKRIGDRYGFGIKGEWQSEYIPGEGCSFYSTINGVEASYDKMSSTEALTTRNYYPLVSIMSLHLAKVKILHYSPPPKEFLSVMKAEKRWISPCYIFNMAISRNGLMSTCAFSNRTEDSHYISESRVGTLDTPFTSCTFKVEDPGPQSKVVFGIGKQTHVFGNSKEYLAFICMDGGVKHGDTGVKLHEVNAKSSVPNDEITFKWYIEKQDESFEGTKEFKTEVYLNGKLYCDYEYPYTFVGGVPQEIILAKFVTGGVRKIRLMQHLPLYRAPGVFRDQITLGYLRRVIISDDGTMECGAQHGINTFGIFVAKTQFNTSLTYFEMEVIACPSRVTIGVAHYDKPPGFYLGMNQCEIGLHNTSELSQIAIGTKKDSRAYSVGDVVGCGVEGDFDDDGFLVPEQEITVYFTRNGDRIETTKLNYVSDGLYPSIMVEKPGCKVRVLNYYSETKADREAVLLAQKEASESVETNEEKIPFFGPQYTVVGVESGSSDAAGKIHILKSMVTAEDLASSKEVQQISEKKKELEEMFSNLTLEEQIYYSKLCVAEENIKKLQAHPERVNFITADTSSSKGMVELKNVIQNTFKALGSHQKLKYVVSKTIPYVAEKIGQCMKKAKLLPCLSSDEQELNLLKEVQKGMEGNLSGTMVHHMLDILHEQGALMTVRTGGSTLAIDIGYAGEMVTRLEKFSATETMSAGKMTSAIGQNSHVWTMNSLVSKIIKEDEPSKISQILQFLEGYLGLIKVPVWRESEKDEQYLYSTTGNLSPPPVKLRDFWSKGEATKNFVVLQKTYSFVHGLPEHLISLVLAATSRYGRLIAMTSDGAVLQMGAVQTTIVQHTGIVDLIMTDVQPLLDKKVLSVESKCYMPDKKSDLMNELTESYVWDYTFRIMCLYTDFIDRIIHWQGLVPLITHNYPTGIVNVSFGCIHNWSPFSNVQQIQSVCTLCNRCCEKGDKCAWNGIMGNYFRECCCKTKQTGCVDCGICVTCAKEMWVRDSV